MAAIDEAIYLMRAHWSDPRIAIHRGAETTFKLNCLFNEGVSEDKITSIGISLPQEAKAFYKIANGATLFKDNKYGQWGLEIYTLDTLTPATNRFFEERSRDALQGDLILGEFLGDSDLLLLRCDPDSHDFGAVVIVSPMDPRLDWDVAAVDLGSFLLEFSSFQGDKFWELK